jgi:hypothetical protein
LECADQSALWSAATCRGRGLLEFNERNGVKPPRAKAVTGHRTPK